MVFVFDEAQMSYEDGDLWNNFFKSIHSYHNCHAIIFASYGNASSRFSCWNIKHDLPEQVTPPTRVFTYFSGSYCAAMCHYTDSMVCLYYLQIPFILLHCYCSCREPFLLFSHCSLAYFTICYKYCCVDSSPLSRLATAHMYKH